LNENTRIGLIGGATPVQVFLPFSIYDLKNSKVLLFVKDEDSFKF
jgi:hypothetical protein